MSMLRPEDGAALILKDGITLQLKVTKTVDIYFRLIDAYISGWHDDQEDKMNLCCDAFEHFYELMTDDDIALVDEITAAADRNVYYDLIGVRDELETRR